MKLVRLGIHLLLTALAVAIPVSAATSFYELAVYGFWSWEAFFAFGALVFVLALIGGTFLGLPAIALANRLSLSDTFMEIALFGAAIGAGAGAITALLFFGASELTFLSAIPLFMLYGAASGVVAGPVWLYLQGARQNREI